MASVVCFTLVSAQDILTRPPSYCAYYYWPHDTLLAKYDTCWFYVGNRSWTKPDFFTNSMSGITLEKPYSIYGISAALYTPLYVLENYGLVSNGDYSFLRVLDTSRAKVRERVRLYRRTGDTSFSVEREVEWCYADHPADWYLTTGHEDAAYSQISMNLQNFIEGDDPLPSIMPMYDLYFDEPFEYIPGDTLYLGVASFSRLAYDSLVNRPGYLNYTVKYFRNFPVYNPVYHFRLNPDGLPHDSIDWSLVDSFSPTDFCGGFYTFSDTSQNPSYHFYALGPRSLLIYPIVAPPQPPQPPQPPAGIQAVEDIEITLGPNPASDRVKVSSSAEITGIAVASIDGRSVYNKPHGGKTATLDIRTWPAGVYFVTVNTPFGSRVHKLLKM